MNSSLSKKSKHLSVSYSFTKSSSYSQCPNMSIRKRRHTSSYKELYLNKINFVSAQTPTSKPKGLDYLYATIYKSNTAKLRKSEYPLAHIDNNTNNNIRVNIYSNIGTNRLIDRCRGSNDVHAKLKDLKKEMMSINKFNTNSSNNMTKGRYSNSNIRGIMYGKGSTNDIAKRLVKGNKVEYSDNDYNKHKGEMILESLGVDKSFEKKLYDAKNGSGEISVNVDGNCDGEVNVNEDDTNFLITDRQEKSVLKGTLVDHNEKGDYEDMNEIKNQLDNAIARSVQNKKLLQNKMNDDNNNNINNNDNDKPPITCANNENEIDKQHEIVITSQTDININNCNVIFKSDSFNYGIMNDMHNTNNNNIQNDNNSNDNDNIKTHHYTLNRNSTSTASQSKQTQNLFLCNNPTSSEDIEITSSIPINFQSTTSLDIKSTKHLHEVRYSNEENEQEQMCSQQETVQTCEDNVNQEERATKGKGHFADNHEIKEEDEENDESAGGSVLKNRRKRTHNNVNDVKHECKLVIEEIQIQKKKLLDMKYNTLHTHINNDYARLQKIKTLLHKTTPQTHNALTAMSKAPLAITNISLTIRDNIKPTPQHHKLPLSPHKAHLTLSNEQAFDILSSPKIYSPNNIKTIHTSQPLTSLSSPLLPQQPQTQFNPTELHSEIDTFLTNLKLRNKSKESHLTTLKLQKEQELQQLKTKQQFFAMQKQVTHVHKSTVPSKESNYAVYVNNMFNDATSINTNNNVHHNNIPSIQQQQQQETRKHTYTSIFNTLLEDDRYNTLRNNMGKRCVKETKYGDMFNQEVEKESDLFLKKVKEDIRDIKSKRRVKEELNELVCGNGYGKGGSRYAVGKRNNCVMPVNSIDGVVDAREIGFFTNYMNNNSSSNNGNGNNVQKINVNINTQSIFGINSFNNYTFKK